MKEYSLYDIESIELYECIEHMKIELKKNNTEYRELFDKIEEIKYEYPNIRGILEDEKTDKLSLDESKALLKTINLYRELFRIEQYHIFLLGGGECFEYLRKIGVI